MADSHLLLLGGGHSHLFVLEALARRALPGVRVTLVSPNPLATYTGMVPGVLSGQYALPAAQIDLGALSARAGATFHAGQAVRIDAPDKTVRLVDGSALAYDLLSVNIGARVAAPPAAGDAPSVVAVKPIESAVAILSALPPPPAAVRIAVVGAGAGGAEIAFGLAARLRDRLSATVTLCDRAARPLDERGAATAARVERALRAAGVQFIGGSEAIGVGASGVSLRGRDPLPADLVVWSTGAIGPALFRDSGLPTDARGFVSVGTDLRSVGDARIFAAGDCASITAHPDLPKAGVYAVRQGPLLARNLRAVLQGARTIPFFPQPRFLSLLNTADGRAVASYGRFAAHNRAAWWLKDWIDRRFVARFRG